MIRIIGIIKGGKLFLKHNKEIGTYHSCPYDPILNWRMKYRMFKISVLINLYFLQIQTM